MTKIVKKPQDTEWFHFHNENPEGQRAGDCVVRAIARATGQTWDETFDGLCVIAKSMHMMPNDKEAYGKYLSTLGWVKHRQPRKADNTKFKGFEFAKAWQKDNSNEPVIFNIGGHHIACIVDGRINDIWNCSQNCIGNYWVKD